MFTNIYKNLNLSRILINFYLLAL